MPSLRVTYETSGMMTAEEAALEEGAAEFLVVTDQRVDIMQLDFGNNAAMNVWLDKVRTQHAVILEGTTTMIPIARIFSIELV